MTRRALFAIDAVVAGAAVAVVAVAGWVKAAVQVAAERL
jgi:hypothetical protein